jgi:hypothetical protein
MLYDDSSIWFFLKRKLEYKPIYISSYVCPNLVMKALWLIYKKNLYMNVDVSIKPNCQCSMELANIS